MEQHHLPCNDHASKIAVLERDMETLLGNGQPGLISRIQDTLENHRAVSESLHRKLYLATGVIIGVIFLSSSGTVSLHGLLELLKIGQ